MVEVLGAGRLHAALRAAVPTTGRLVVTARDGWDHRDHDAARATALPWLPVWTEPGRVVVGPWHEPGRPGCPTCAERRRRDARGHRVDDIRARHTAAAWLGGLAVDTVAALVRGDVDRWLAGADPAARDAVLFLDLATLDLSRHPVLPDPHCPDCGRLPDDAPGPAPVVTGRRAGYRSRSLVDEADRLHATYVDAETGLIRAVSRGTDGGLVLATAELGRRPDEEHAESGYGRGHGYRTTAVTAIAEALERHGGMRPGGRRPVVRAPFAQVRAHAVDPRTLGLYPDDRYRLDGFRFVPFRPDVPYRWVWGWSFARNAPVLVPESYAYYRTRATYPDEPGLAYEVSNGCALGSDLAEAVGHGIFEVAERDAFLLTWYARRTVPGIDLAAAPDRRVPLLAAAIEAETGYRVRLFDITAEPGLPAVWALAVGPAGRARAACAAACHLDPVRAATNALGELGPLLPGLNRAYPAQAARVRAMAGDPDLVEDMADHGLLYADPAVFDRFDFLTANPADTPEFWRRGAAPEPVAATIDRFLHCGLDVVVVDQTTPEHTAFGFHCVKVIIPGTLPMTFGHRNRRTHGLPRLARLVGSGQVNPHPHPFP